MAVAAIAIIAGLAGCGGDDSASEAAAPATTVVAGPVITALSATPEVACTGTETTARIAWRTENAASVEFSVDGEAVPARAGGVYATSGAGDIPIPCSNGRHRIDVVAEADGNTVSEGLTVTTARRAVVHPRPIVRTVSAPPSVRCASGETAVRVRWTTENARAVQLGVDGRPLTAASDEPVDASAEVPLPCDGDSHRVEVTAYGVGTSAASFAVNVATVVDRPADHPSIDAFAMPAEVACTGAQAAVPVTWTTSNAEGVSFAVDGQSVPAGAGYPASGRGSVAVPCDNADHTVTLTAGGAGGTSVEHEGTVHTVPRRAPAARPAVTLLTMPSRIGCTTGESAAQVRVEWRTRNTEAVAFHLDGEPLPGQGALPVRGSAGLTVPCDGSRHIFTLVAEGTGTSTAQAARPITAIPAQSGSQSAAAVTTATASDQSAATDPGSVPTPTP